MRLYIWEGDGISDSYHDDGTLVVLAESPEQARQLVRDRRLERDAEEKAYSAETAALLAEFDRPLYEFDAWAAARRTAPWPEFSSNIWDGTDAALDREPDRTVELDQPTWVAFNGGGYD